MSTVLKIFLSMSFSGGLLILALLLGKRFLKDKISRQWQYYIWLLVILRLLLPFGPETNLMGKTYQAVDQAITQASSPPRQENPLAGPEDAPTPAAGPEQREEPANRPAQDLTAVSPRQDIGVWLADHIWLIWPAAALGLLIRKITIYQGFVRYIHAGTVPVSDVEVLDRLSAAAERAGIQSPVELCVNPLISSPLLIGFFHPCIVLPSADISETDFQYIALHELTHYQRRDMFYKWLAQITVCLHWFNPLVHLMCREITNACEFSCDEAVLAKTGYNHAQDYGQTLLDAMAAVGKYRENPGAVTLSENKQLLKERLSAIMKFKKKSVAIRFLTGALTLCVVFCAVFVGVYPAAAAFNQTTGKPQVSGDKDSTQKGTGTYSGDDASQAARYYEAGSLPLFQISFSRLDGTAQREWLEKLYAGDDFAFFSVAVRTLDEDDPLIDAFAEKAYADGEIAFFSTLTDRMDETDLERWLDKALEDGIWSFQSMLFDKLDRDDEFDEPEEKREKEWEAAQRAEYQAAGVTMDGKDYYYQGQLVNIFLDIRKEGSFYVLDMNPKGTVNIKITRNADDRITGAAYMSDSEVTSLLSDMYDPDDEDRDKDRDGPDETWDNSETVSVPVDIAEVKDGGYVWLGTYTLNEGDRVCYNVSAESGEQLDVGFAKPGQTSPEVRYNMVSCRRTDGKLEIRTGAMTWKSPVKPGEYRLFLHTEGGALAHVRGSVTIMKAAQNSQ